MTHQRGLEQKKATPFKTDLPFFSFSTLYKLEEFSDGVGLTLCLDNLYGTSSASFRMFEALAILSSRLKALDKGKYDVFGTLRSPKILQRRYSFTLKYKTSREAARETRPILPN